jgi:Cu-Zn family superoxide dismutase
MVACQGGGAPAPVESVLRDATGADVGRAILRERGEQVQVHVRVAGLTPGEHGLHLHAVGKCDPLRVAGLTPGEHGLHLHAVGKCDPPGFESAGGHFNPTNHKHGRLNPQGPHEGDLGNLFVSADGRGEKTVDLVGAEARSGLQALLGASGLALVVHGGRDDEATDPSGNSGPRVACAVLGP